MDFLLIGTTLILIHEMDAIRCNEWRMIPGLSQLTDRMGMIVFILAHIPLFYWILFEIQAGNENFIFGFNIFLIVHFILHLVFLTHRRNEFRDWISWIIISSSGICGLADLLY